MRVIIKCNMFYVLDSSNNEKACFKSFRMLADYIIVMQMVGVSIEAC